MSENDASLIDENFDNANTMSAEDVIQAVANIHWKATGYINRNKIDRDAWGILHPAIETEFVKK